jgi:hypothetical protein
MHLNVTNRKFLTYKEEEINETDQLIETESKKMTVNDLEYEQALTTIGELYLSFLLFNFLFIDFILKVLVNFNGFY